VRFAAVLGLAGGLFVATAVIGYFDLGAVIAAIRPVGAGGFALVVLAQLALCVPLGLAWWTLAFGQRLSRLWAFSWSSLVAEAASNLLPFSQLGGAAAASRAVMIAGVLPATAVGSNVVDITLELAAQFLYALAGAAYLLHRLRLASGAPMMVAVLAGLAGALVMLAGLLAAQRWALPFLVQAVRRA
jgi:hypothetical protein